MGLKKLMEKLTTVVAAGAMVMSIGGGVVWANNCTGNTCGVRWK